MTAVVAVVVKVAAETFATAANCHGIFPCIFSIWII